MECTQQCWQNIYYMALLLKEKGLNIIYVLYGFLSQFSYIIILHLPHKSHVTEKLEHAIGSPRTAKGALDSIINAVARFTPWKFQVEWTRVTSLLVVFIVVWWFVTIVRVRLDNCHLVYAECVQILFSTCALWHFSSEFSLRMDGKERGDLFVVAMQMNQKVWVRVEGEIGLNRWADSAWSINSPVIALVFNQSLTLDITWKRQSIDWNHCRFLEVLFSTVLA